VIPPSSRQLSDGLLIETSVLARLLGIKLLTLEGTVVLSPAQLQGGLSLGVSTSPQAGRLGTAKRTRDAASSATRPHGRLGDRLALSARLLDECADELRALDQRLAEKNAAPVPLAIV
jgi:hypothetical protein